MLRTALRRPLATVVALVLGAGLGAGLGAAPAADADPAAKQRQVRGKILATSSLSATIDWAYDVNAKGVGYAVWVDGDSDRRRVLVAKRTAKGGWGKPQRLSGLFSRTGKREYAGEPDVAVDSKGRATVVWAQSTGPGVRLRVVSSKGKGWTKPRNLSAKKDFAGFPDVEVSDKGHAVVHWAGDFPFGASDFSLLAAYRERNGSWSRPERLDTSPDFKLDARPESIAIDDRGLATVAWDELGATDRIQVASRGPATGWVQQTLAAGADLNAPAVTTTPDGQLVAAWRDGDGISAQRRSAAGAWAPAQKVVAGPAGTVHNFYGAGISDTGRVALLGREVDFSGSNKVRPYVLVQDGPGSPWRQEYVTGRYPQYGIDVFLPEIRVGRRGEVGVTWNEQFKNESRGFRTFVRTLTRNGRWKPTVQLAGRTDNPALGVDGKGRFSVVFGAGENLPGCCIVLRAANLP